jgi:hypothetical protein
MDQNSEQDTAPSKQPATRLPGEYWDQRYALGETDWDKGAPSPGLVDFLRLDAHVPGRVLVPGCGRGHDVRTLAQAGFDATGLDVAAVPVRDATELARAAGLSNATFMHGDFFRADPAWRGRFDWMFEHTFFCAIDPTLRDQYVEQASNLLRQDGHLLGVFYNIQPEDEGPPFGTTRGELVERFRRRFDLVLERVPRSYPNRAGKELLMLWRKRVLD